MVLVDAVSNRSNTVAVDVRSILEHVDRGELPIEVKRGLDTVYGEADVVHGEKNGAAHDD